MIGYLIMLALIVVCYPIAVVGLGRIKNERLVVLVVPFILFALYIYCVVQIGISVGINDWNFQNALPTANVSPFTYCLTPCICLFPNRIKKYLYALVALLSLGLLGAGIMNCVFNIARNYAFHWTIAIDTLIHVALSLFGVYLVKCGRAKLNLTTALTGGAILVGVAMVMLVLNVIFKTAFFGLSIYGRHNIYNVVVCKNGYLSALLYFSGLCAVLVLGALYQKLVNKTQEKGKN